MRPACGGAAATESSANVTAADWCPASDTTAQMATAVAATAAEKATMATAPLRVCGAASTTSGAMYTGAAGFHQTLMATAKSSATSTACRGAENDVGIAGGGGPAPNPRI